MTPLELVSAWLLSAALAWAPVVPGAPAKLREDIARDVARVAYDPSERPLYAGEHGRAKSALLVLAIASLESGGFRSDVDAGDKRGSRGEVCIMQLLLKGPGWRISLDSDTYSYSTTDGWSYDDLARDRGKCLRAGYHKVRESLRACRDLSLYTGGKCDANEPKAKHRSGRAEGWWRHAPFTMHDLEVLASPS